MPAFHSETAKFYGGFEHLAGLGMPRFEPSLADTLFSDGVTFLGVHSGSRRDAVQTPSTNTILDSFSPGTKK